MALSGQKTVTTHGTAEALGTQTVNAPLMVKALTSNTDLVYLGNDGAGDVSSANGMPLEAGEVIVFDYADSLARLMLDSAVDGEGVSWLILSA